MQHKSTGNPREARRGRHVSAPLDEPAAAARQKPAHSPSHSSSVPARPAAEPGAPGRVEPQAKTAPAPARRPERPARPAPPPRPQREQRASTRPEGILKELGLQSQQDSPYRRSGVNPNVRYLSGDVLSRPLDIPRGSRRGLYVSVALAVVLACAFVFVFLDTTASAPAREIEKMEESLSRDVSLDLPDMASLLPLDDASIDAKLKETGATFFERKPAGTAEVYEIVKLPSDVTLLEAGELYAIGIGKLSAPQAVTLLNGSWDLAVERKNGMNMSLHYADFKSGSLENVITNAVAAENLAQGGEPDRGEDDGFGNAYATGPITVADKNYTWTVSACPLKQVYSVAGLPDDAAYVGIRIKSA